MTYMDTIKLDSIEEAIADFREGKFVIAVDAEDFSRSSLCTHHNIAL